MRIDILVLDGAFDSGLAALQDTLAVAGELGAADACVLDVGLVAIRAGPRTAHGWRVPVRVARAGPAPDVVLVPAIGAKTPETLPAALAHPDIAAAGRLLRRWSADGALVAAACTGGFVLAESGLLDGRAATTSWWLAPFFRARYPAVQLDDGRMLVGDDAVVTAGALLAHFDLALWIVRRVSPSVAATVARYLLLDSRSSQAAYAIPDHLHHDDAVVTRFEEWARANLGAGFSLAAAARAAGASSRTLCRRTQVALGRSPLGYFQDLRIERARHLLLTTGQSVDRIAAEVGYADGVTLRTLLRRRTGLSASQLRRHTDLFGTEV